MRRVLTMVAAALVLVGCNRPTPNDPLCRIGFSSQVARSMIESNADLQQQELKLYGSYTLWGNSARLFDGEQLYFDPQLPGWDYATTQYWIMGANYNFFAVCPYNTSCIFSEAQHALTIVDYESETEGPDLLYATASRDLSEREDFSTVNLSFRHACAAVKFNLVNASNSVLIDVRNIRLVGLCNKGNLRVEAGGVANWTLSEQVVQPNAAEQPFAGVCVLPEGGLPVNIGVKYPLYEHGAVVVLPQTIYKSGVTLHLEYKKSGDAEYAVRAIQLGMLGGTTPTEWKPGELYEYNLNITDNTITTEVRVIDWIDHFVDL